ncbi:MAG: exosortase/archaeosortase family protein [Undibacterium sp.]|nr:exosortase/archaeosortase family protein [Opitutaceae bacterium]
MNSSTTAPGYTCPSDRPAALRRWPWKTWAPTGALLALLWLFIFNQQRLEWTVNVVYAYGWAVPAMALFLLWERWRTRPEAQTPMLAPAMLAGGALLLAVYLPVRVIQEANPDWVKINWSLATLAVGLSWLALAATGGARYALHFTFPLLFCFSALPWPVWMETYLVQELMRGNAAICAEILTFLGTPAIAEGNLIQVADRWVNVEEACSGIRSLQTAFMMSLFLGELHRLSAARRVGLLAASFGFAFFVNLLRTLLLTYLARTPGVAERWHDTIGIVAMIGCLVALWGLSEWFRPRRRAAVAVVPSAAPEFDRVPFPRWFAVAGCAWLVAAEALTGFWYSYHERQVPPSVAWHVAWPEKALHFQRGEFAERTLALLKFNDGATASWSAEGVYPWQMYALNWQPGRVSKFLSSSHYPTVCLPATGLKLVAELGGWECEANGVRIPFATYLFNQAGRDVYVFHAIIEDRPLRAGERFSYRQVDSSERLRSVWQGERNLGQHVIGIALLAASSPEEARGVVTRVLHSVIRPGPAVDSGPPQKSL